MMNVLPNESYSKRSRRRDGLFLGLLMGVACAIGSARAEVDPTDLLLELRFSGNTLDSSGSGHDMTNFGATLGPDRHGNTDSAYYFDGVDDYMRYTGATFSTGDFTLSLWVTVDSFPSWYRYAFAVHSGAGGINLGDRNIGLILANVNQLGGRYATSEGQNNPAPEAYVDLTPLGSWKHIVFVREGSEQRLYYNGILVSTLTDSLGSFTVNNGLIEVGAPNFWNGGWSQNGRAGAKWHGGIDDLRVYQRSLSDAEIGELLVEGLDDDGDGVLNSVDSCPDSDLNPTVVIDGCDTGVANAFVTDGCTITDAIMELALGARNHGQFVRSVSHLANALKRQGLISGREKGALVRCAAGAQLP